MQAMSSEALPLTATAQGVIQEWATQLTLIYARAPRLRNSVIAYLIVACIPFLFAWLHRL